MIELPQCRWRGEQLPTGKWACLSKKLVGHENGVEGEFCGRCWYVDHADPVPASTALVPTTMVPTAQSLDEVKSRLKLSKLPCIHLGEPTGEVQECPTCTGKVEVKLRACAIHGKCTTDKLLPQIACCNICPDKNTTPPPRPASILITGGIGDAFALDSLMAVEERETLETIYYACPAWREISQLFRALPNFPRLKNHVALPSGNKVHYAKASVEADHGQVDAEDWSIATVFPQGRSYSGSSFLTHPLHQARHIGRPYVFICPQSNWGRWDDRNFHADDWHRCLEFLDRRNLAGLVIGQGANPPASSRLINLSDQTTILEGVELLKGAAGYLGIDTCWSVLAAKLFPGNRLCVKSVWGHCYEWQHVYFAPRKEFGFLRRQLEAPAWS